MIWWEIRGRDTTFKDSPIDLLAKIPDSKGAGEQAAREIMGSYADAGYADLTITRVEEGVSMDKTWKGTLSSPDDPLNATAQILLKVVDPAGACIHILNLSCQEQINLAPLVNSGKLVEITGEEYQPEGSPSTWIRVHDWRPV